MGFLSIGFRRVLKNSHLQVESHEKKAHRLKARATLCGAVNLSSHLAKLSHFSLRDFGRQRVELILNDPSSPLDSLVQFCSFPWHKSTVAATARARKLQNCDQHRAILPIN
jgi:hypothetical protein